MIECRYCKAYAIIALVVGACVLILGWVNTRCPCV